MLRRIVSVLIVVTTITGCAQKEYPPPTIPLPIGWEPPCYREWDEEDKKPEKFCNGDVLYEGAPPSCMEIYWCYNKGIRPSATDFATCGDYVGDCGGPRDAAYMKEAEHACRIIKPKSYCAKAQIFNRRLRGRK